VSKLSNSSATKAELIRAASEKFATCTLLIEVTGPDAKLVAKCRNRIARRASSEVNALLRLAAVKRANVCFTSTTTSPATGKEVA
jgi:hypothetical protein